jgi:hypothetical protein
MTQLLFNESSSGRRQIWWPLRGRQRKFTRSSRPAATAAILTPLGQPMALTPTLGLDPKI